MGVLLNACISFENGWNVPIPNENAENPEQVLEKVAQLESEADTAESVEVLLNTLKEVEVVLTIVTSDILSQVYYLARIL